MSTTNLDSIKTKSISTPSGKTFANGTAGADTATTTPTGTKLTGTLTPPADTATSAKLADLTSLQTKHNAVVDDIATIAGKVDAMRVILRSWGLMS